MRRYDLGCPKDGICDLHKKLGNDVPCSVDAQCKNYVNVVIPRHDPVFLPRLRHVMRLEAMVTVGCQFQPHDLSPQEWDELIALAGERNVMDEEVAQLRAKQSEPSANITAEEVKGVQEARRQVGAPAPGQSLFK